MTITNYLAENGKSMYSVKMIEELTGVGKNELAYNIRQLKIHPEKWNNKWLLSKDDVLELMNYILLIYRIKMIRLMK